MVIGERIEAGSIVLVTWRDAWFEIDSSGSWPDEYRCQTVGWLLSSDETWLRVAGEQTPTGERALTHIPSEQVQSVLVLRPPNPTTS